MQAVTTIGLDIAKSVFQVHAWLVSRPAPHRIIGRELKALGHTVRLMPPADVKRPSGRVRDRSPGGAQGRRATTCGRHGYE